MRPGSSLRLHRILIFVLALASAVDVSAAGLEIAGVGDDIEQNVRAFVALANEDCEAPRWRIRRRFRDVDEQVATALEAYGYYTAALTKNLDWTDDCWQAVLKIELGKPVSLRKLDFRLAGAARQDGSFKNIAVSRGLEIGSPFRHADYRRTKQRLQAMASDRGYFSGELTMARVDIWPEEFAADVTLHFDSGERYRFGEIVLNQDFLDPEFVRRYVDIVPGQPYHSERLAELQQDLNASGYFSSVEIRPDIAASSERQVPISITLTPAQRLAYSVGVGFSTDSGPRFRTGYENRRVNTRGHQYSGDLLYSPVLSELSTTYRLPLEDPDSEWLSFSAGLQIEDTDTSESERASLGVKRVSKLPRDWLRTDAVALQLDRYEVGADEDTSRLLMPSVGFSRKRADQPINPNRGHRLNFELRGASDALGSSTSFLQLMASARLIHPLGKKGRLLLRAEGGTTLKDAFRELPPSVRFFAGGTESVRGFGFQTIGPENADGVVIGGSRLLTGSVEYDRLFYRNFAYAVFADAGNAFDGTNVDARLAAGLGLKWRSPIGPVRVYLAHPLNYSDRSVRLHISIGPDL